LTHVYLAEDLVRNPLRLENRRIELRSAPGLGVEVDEDAVRRFAVS
jgi:L-alanine-DL-glutamate epimerase-like enolase superfamily enzyme